MNRLTEKRADGRWAISNNDGASPTEQMLKIPIAIDRLAAYEDTGLTPEEIMALIPPPNAPLTLEELRGMGEKPVWLVGANDAEIDGNGYAVVDFRYYGDKDTPICFWFGNEVEMKPRVNNYGKTWLAYRRRPEGVK